MKNEKEEKRSKAQQVIYTLFANEDLTIVGLTQAKYRVKFISRYVDFSVFFQPFYEMKTELRSFGSLELANSLIKASLEPSNSVRKIFSLASLCGTFFQEKYGVSYS